MRLFLIPLLLLAVVSVYASSSADAESPIVQVPYFTGGAAIEPNQRLGRRPKEPIQPPTPPAEAPPFEFPARDAEPAPDPLPQPVPPGSSDSPKGIGGILGAIFGGAGFSEWTQEDWSAFFDKIMVLVTSLIGMFGGMSAKKRGGLLRFLERKLI